MKISIEKLDDGTGVITVSGENTHGQGFLKQQVLEPIIYGALEKLKNGDLSIVSKCSAKKCNEPTYEFGMCHKHFCISEMDAQSGC